MNYSVYKFTENENGFYFYFLSPFSEQNVDCVCEFIEHYISNEHTQMIQYLLHCDFDNTKIEKVSHLPAIDVINKTTSVIDPKCMNVSNDFVALIPPPKPKREPKKKADAVAGATKEPKPAKPRGKKSTQNVNISIAPQSLDMS